MTTAIAYTDGKAQTPVGPSKPLPVILSGIEGGASGSISPYAGSLTATIVTLSAATSEPLIGANPTRKGLRWMNIGLNPMTVVPGGGSAVVGNGFAYSGAPVAGAQGGADTFEGTSVPTNAFQAISTLGTTVIVWETN